MFLFVKSGDFVLTFFVYTLYLCIFVIQEIKIVSMKPIADDKVYIDLETEGWVGNKRTSSKVDIGNLYFTLENKKYCLDFVVQIQVDESRELESYDNEGWQEVTNEDISFYEINLILEDTNTLIKINKDLISEYKKFILANLEYNIND